MFVARRTRYKTTSKCLATARQNKSNNIMKLKWNYFNPSVEKTYDYYTYIYTDVLRLRQKKKYDSGDHC